MATYTGPDKNTYLIPEVQLGDNFNLWRDVTNTSVYKLNKLKIYDGVSSGSINVNVSEGGTASFALSETVTTGHTFAGNINFGGTVVFNSPVVTINSNVVTIDDYNLVLGDTAEAKDQRIIDVGGGGIILNRVEGSSASWQWQPAPSFGAAALHGSTGIWMSSSHIGLCGSTSGIYAPDGGTLRVYGSGIRIVDSGSTSSHGLNITLNTSEPNENRTITLSRFAPTGITAFAQVLFGSTYGGRPFFDIRDGVNRKRVTQTSHGLTFGTPVYLKSDGLYAPASCVDVVQAETVGVVSRVVDANTFDFTFSGEIHGNFGPVILSGSTLVTGGVYYLSEEPGKLASAPSTAAGTVHKAVFIATGQYSAVVVPFTGGLLAEDVAVTSSANLARIVFQLNRFKVGDALRWIAGATGLSYAYNGGGHTFTPLNYYDGVFVKGQANTQEEAEVIGIVSSVTPIDLAANTSTVSSPKVNYKFTLLTNGYFGEPNGVCATNSSGVNGNLVGGDQYFLSTNSAASPSTTSPCLESPTPSLISTPPTVVGTVRKPVLFSGTTVSAYVLIYRGDVNNDTLPVFTGYTGSLAHREDLPIGSVVMGLTGFTTGLPPNSGITLYYHNVGGFSGDYVIATSTSPVGVTLNGAWKTRGRSVVSGGAGGATAYFLCQRIS